MTPSSTTVEEAAISPPSSETRPLAVTLGEPAGIGLDTVISAWARGGVAPFYLIAPPALVLTRAAAMGVALRTQTIDAPAEAVTAFESALPVLPLDDEHDVVPGEPSAETGAMVIAAVERAVDDALSGAAAGIVTAPINKRVLYQAGFCYPGHTEYLAALCRQKAPEAYFDGPVMMLVCEGLRVVPLTVHMPLREVCENISSGLIVRTATIVTRSLKTDFGIQEPRVVVAGLNPHAGENGQLGTEDESIIAPAVGRLRNQGMAVHGPLPADTLFHTQARERYDAVLCMYHDQALIPLKTLDFWGGVNVTLGLPIVRTSPDHGTALSLAATGTANPESMIAAIRMAAEISGRRHSGTA